MRDKRTSSTLPPTSGGQGTASHDPRQANRIAYTVAEVATLLNKHPNTVYEWVRKGSLPSERVGGTIFIPKWALARLIAPEADGVLAPATAPAGGEAA
jgi:excisionase family DNA binding protein